MSAQRIEVADALRAFALAGILQVNVQSFAWGAGDPLGLFAQPPTRIDAAVHLLLGTFVVSKFLSIFALLFGFGFALQWRALRRRSAIVEARDAYRRRLRFLLAVGIAHGLLLYYGDILTAYALAGFVLLGYAGARPAELVAATRRWWLAFALLTVVSTALFELWRGVTPLEFDPRQIPDQALDRLAVYAQGGFVDQIAVRGADYASVLAATMALALPQLMGLFLLGVLGGRLGWLARPQRHPRIWRLATRIGIAAVPVAALGAWVNFDTFSHTPGDPGYIGYALQNAGSLVACLYVAAFVHGQAHPAFRRLIAWLAPAGKMPLTNYIAQSVFMGAALSGWGFGLGDRLGRVQLAAIALGFVAVQLVASRWWIGRYGHGPLEALWRRATYGV